MINKPLIPLVKIESMSSLEIAELVGSKHANVRISIERLMLRGVIATSALQTYKNINNLEIEGYSITKRDSYVVVAQISPEFTGKLVDRWIFVEEQLRIIQQREGTKKFQLEAMEALRHLLPDNLSSEALSYIKANTIVNKAVSTLFGFPKMLSKDAMSTDMLEIRDKVLDDYIKLYEVIEDNSIIKKVLYEKYQPRRLESQ